MRNNSSVLVPSYLHLFGGVFFCERDLAGDPPLRYLLKSFFVGSTSASVGELLYFSRPQTVRIPMPVLLQDEIRMTSWDAWKCAAH